MKLPELFDKTAKVFKRHRWIQGAWKSTSGTCGYCLLGAIGKAQGDPYKHQTKAHPVPGGDYLVKAIDIEFPGRSYRVNRDNCENIFRFNDNPKTTRKDVLKVLQKAKELAIMDESLQQNINTNQGETYAF